MRAIVLAACLALPLAAWAWADDKKDLSRVTLPDDKEAALKTLKEWITARGFEVEDRKTVLLMRRSGVLINLAPIVHKGELDRIRAAVYYSAKDEHKKTKEFEAMAAKLNRAQNFFQVFVDDEGDLCAATNLTFFDEISAKEFDAFVDAVAQIVKRHILTEEAVKMLK